MDVHTVLFEILGAKITLVEIGAAFAGAVPVLATLYKLNERWQTREQRRLDLLHKYLDKEERDISAKRRTILTGIRLAHEAYLTDKNLDVGREIDDAIAFLDSGRPQRAEARLGELLRKIQNNTRILERRVEDLKKHERSVNIFLAAISDREGKPDQGLGYISDALASDSRDPDALKYKGLLLLQKGDLDLARQAFDRLKDNGTVGGRAEGYLGLGKVNQKLGAARHEETAQYLKNCVANLNKLKPDEQDALTKVELHEQLARLQGDPGNSQHDVVTAIDNCKKSMVALSTLPRDGRFVSDKNRALSALLWNLEQSPSSQNNVDPQPPGNAA